MSNNHSIRPFRVQISDAELEDLRARVNRTRWPDGPSVAGWERGVPRDYLEGLTAYWADRFDWRAQERALNEHPQFTTEIDGQPIHFVHVRSPEPGALPLLLTHGWPSSPVEFLDVVDPLADPRAHGGDPADAFELVIPSLPGYGFSTPVREPGWGNLFRVAAAWAELMRRLGHDRYAVHGTDVGSGVAGMLAMLAPDRVVGTHVTGTVAAMPFGPPLEIEGLSGPDRARAERFNAYRANGLGYLHLQATRPQTIAYALSDSPAAQLAWIVEKFHEWTDPAVELPDRAVDRDRLLANVSVSWFSRAGASAAHATYEGVQAWRDAVARGTEAGERDEPHRSPPPRGVAVFAADTTVRRVMDPDGEIEHWSEFDRGGHFPAMEVPELLAGDLRAFFRGLR